MKWRRKSKRFMLRYHIQGKLALWGVAIVVFSMIASELLSAFIGPALLDYIDYDARRAFLAYLPDVLTTILFFIIASLAIILTAKPMVNRVLELSLAAKEISRGNYDVRVSEEDKHDEVFQLAKDFNLMAEELRRNEYLRKDFISSVSHELKTPLAVIGGYTDLLKSPELSETDRKEYLDIVSREVARLQKLCVNMLNISKLDHCLILERKSQYSLDEQIRQAILLLEGKWSVKKIELDIDLPEMYIFANEDLMQEVWINILDNAIKFCGVNGRIDISGKIVTGYACISIQDNGIGMTAECLERVFEQFYQAEHTYRQEGAGLGLSIVKRIVDLHNGKIDIVSRKGQGTTVTVKLPLEEITE